MPIVVSSDAHQIKALDYVDFGVAQARRGVADGRAGGQHANVGAAEEADVSAGPRAVIFDLWNTIAVWPRTPGAETRPQVAEHLGLTIEEFESAGMATSPTQRETGLIEDVLALFDLWPGG